MNPQSDPGHETTVARTRRILLLGFDNGQVNTLRAFGHARPDLDIHIYSRRSEDLDSHRIPEGFYDSIAVSTTESTHDVLAELLTVADAVPHEQVLILWAPKIPSALLPVLIQAGYTDILSASDQGLVELHQSLLGLGPSTAARSACSAGPALLILDAHDRPAYANAAARALGRAELRKLLECSGDQRWESLGEGLADLAPVSEEPLDWNIQGRIAGKAQQALWLLRVRETGRRRPRDQRATDAYSEALTGLPNRSAFLAHAQQLLGRRFGHPVSWSLLLINLDRTHQINHAMGAHAGDRLIRITAHRIRDLLRDGDHIFHLGGDSFAVLVQHSVNSAPVQRCAEKLLTHCSEPVPLDGQALSPRISIGIAGSPENASEPINLLQCADQALKRIKLGGGGQYAFCDPAHGSRARQRWELLNELHGAVRDQAFELAFQPELSGDGRQLLGAEALLRWRSADGKPQSPAEFVPILEQSGLIVPVGQWILQQACQFGQSLRDNNQPTLKISVNLSPIQFLARDLVQQVRNALDSSGFPPDSLDMEITEGVLLDQADAARVQVRALADLGVNLWIDDFGTGYSSIAYLKQLPLQGLKIDRSFVNGLGRDTRDEAVVRATMQLAHGFGLSVIAEGVETISQAEQLQMMGVQRLQGFLFSPGVSADEFRRLRLRPADTALAD